jgi:hypothetical protein
MSSHLGYRVGGATAAPLVTIFFISGEHVRKPLSINESENYVPRNSAE